jgi:hypothetical protein
MPKAYFEPENLNALTEVFTEVKRRLIAIGMVEPTMLDTVAGRILRMAADGVPPQTILNKVIPMSAAEGGLPRSPDEVVATEAAHGK